MMRRKLIISFLFLFIFLPTLKASEGTVIFLHGFLRDYKAMLPVGAAVKNLGYDICYWDYPSRDFTIREHARLLVSLLQKKAQENPGQPIHFVCHSLGSLIVRTALNYPDCPCEAKTGKAVLLAPPNRGSHLAQSVQDVALIRWIMGTKAGWELTHYTECDMIKLGNFPPTMKVLVIAGTKGLHIVFDKSNDGILAVDETILNTPHCLCRVPTGHGKLMEHPKSIIMIKKFLRNK